MMTFAVKDESLARMLHSDKAALRSVMATLKSADLQLWERREYEVVRKTCVGRIIDLLRGLRGLGLELRRELLRCPEDLSRANLERPILPWSPGCVRNS